MKCIFVHGIIILILYTQYSCEINMILKEIQFDLIQTNYEKITVRDDRDTLISAYDTLPKRYNYFVVI